MRTSGERGRGLRRYPRLQPHLQPGSPCSPPPRASDHHPHVQRTRERRSNRRRHTRDSRGRPHSDRRRWISRRDGGSSRRDGSDERCHRSSASTDEARPGRAYVAAFRELLARDADIVVQIDADFSHPVRFLPSLLEPLRAGQADLVLGSRYVKGGHIPRWNVLRRLISRGGSIFAGVVLLMPYKDLTGGFKAWRATVLREIDLDRLHAGGYAFQSRPPFAPASPAPASLKSLSRSRSAEPGRRR